ncbi:caspase family protein [Pseudanabaena sp. FACHB-2040]|uniref:caspase family protein n=1 Tax=Pseudanabaena sp. FACHB-2040 TaxID=2692859 RepID=UPI0016835848|nr:caspase family protein [Pseudanabaena sp. FACHB-2040]MBD2259323.1 caspase family protein [Pseudanabaena sp. FACHB-2040]
MPSIKRRQFLQFAGSALAAAGLSQLDVRRQADRYGRALAQSPSRKLALLVGINEYPAEVTSLRGCLNDVRMQRELLVHRFGFSPNDILILTDAAATRQNILDAFESHLIAQAQPGDGVVFHFSGHGSLVRDPDPIALPEGAGYDGVEGYNGTMLPYDARTNTRDSQVNDIMGKTLFLLMSALKTDQVTVMLDSCHSGGGTRGDLLVRAVESRVGLGEAGPSDEEIAAQEKWMTHLGWSPRELKERRTRGIAKGVALGSAQANQLAADASFGAAGPGQFYAGAFTYALTRYLWQQPGSLPLERVFVDLARSTRDVANSARIVQSPIYEIEPGRNYDQEPLYFSRPQVPAAEAVILGTENGEVRFWLGGVSSQSLDAFESGAIFSITDANGNETGQIEQTRRVGLEGYGVLKGARSVPQAGMLLRERVRGVPADLTLRVGLNPSLGSDLVEARSQLARFNRIEPVAVNGENSPHYLLGRMTEAGRAIATAEAVRNVGEIGSIGLFTPGLVAIRDSFGEPNEPIAAGIERLNAPLKLLLAGRVLRSVLNSDTSNLSVNVAVQPVDSAVAVGRSASRGSQEGLVAQRLDGPVRELRSGTEIVVNVTNAEDRNLYIGILAIGGSGRITVLHPTDWDAPESESLLEPGQSVMIPRQELSRDRNRNYCADPSEAFHLCLSSSGYAEILTIASTSPLRDALRGLQQIAEENQTRSGNPIGLQNDEPVDVVENLLGDIDRNTRGDVEVRGGARGVDTTKLAALSTLVRIVAD